MQTKQLTFKEYFKALTIIHLALVLGLLLFAAIIIFLDSKGRLNIGDGDLDEIFQIAVPVLIGVCLIANSLITKNRIESIKTKATLKEKLGHYQTLLIIKYALLEAPGMFALICYLLTANLIYLGLAGFMILMLFLNRPNKMKLVMDLELNREEKAALEDPKATVAEVKMSK